MSSPIKRIVVKPGQILYIETPLGSIAIEPNRTDLKGRIYDHISLIPTNKLILKNSSPLSLLIPCFSYKD
ncbi:hypothetical protein LCGC14_1616260 [marine sediment metagenome]|uniref:Uncharacterized protein n=1 Tax=marine sediment metagenome TaxID=412755 RepID=A0A0F9L6S3_9ZZZZ